MSTVVSEPRMAEPQHDPSVPDVTLLEDKLPDWFRLPARSVAFAGMMAVVYWWYSMLPIWHTDVWGHLSYGKLIYESASIPATEPLMPLSKGIPFLDTAWLSQVIGYLMHAAVGRAGLKFLFGAAISLSTGLLTWRVWRQTHLAWIAALTPALFLWVNHQQLIIMRPQVAGMLIFSALICLLTSTRHHRKAIWAVPVLMVLWTNLHGSFTVGLALLGAFTVGRAIDVYRRTGRFGAIARDVRFRSFLVMLELGAVATLLNPYGLTIYGAVIDAAHNPNMLGVGEWQPLTLRQQQGQAMVIVGLLLAVLYRVSPRRVTSAEVLSIVGLGVASLWSSRFVAWWAPLAAVYLPMHLGAVIRRWKKLGFEPAPQARASFWTVIAVGLLWVGFALSPMGVVAMTNFDVKALGKNQAKYVNKVGDQTPEGVAKYLMKNPPQGLIFNPYEWGDYLLWESLKDSKDLKVFVASHAQFISPEVWEDYVSIVETRSNWETNFDRYGINTIVLDEKFRGPLIRRLLESENWKLDYRDEIGTVLSRKKKI